MLTKILVSTAFYLFYWFCCFLCTGTDRKNLGGLRSYPDSIQQKVRKHKDFCKIAPKEKSILSILIGSLLLFSVVFSILGLALKNVLILNSFRTAFLFFLALGEGLGVFDLVIIDLLWWRNTKRIRFSFLPDKADYQNPDKHIGSFLRGIPLFAVVAVITAIIVTVL